MATPQPAAAGSSGDTQGAKVTIHRISTEGTGKAVGTITLRDSPHGLLVIPNLKGMGKARPHAAHVHENGTCAPAERDGEMVAGAAAGGHYDPEGTGAYTGPYLPGALGDLPNLYVEPGGRSTIPVLAPRLSVSDVRGHALMIHAMPDRYGPRTADDGGHGDHAHSHGGTRAYCGVIPEG
ncbi:superoxide dismutase family protein [Limimonas halophila]|nr:superoxide dismutase family protein [Limimonas halophila]